VTKDFTPPVRADLVGVAPYGAPQRSDAIALNVNENPFPPSAAMCEAIGAAARDASMHLNRYPDREAIALRAALGHYLAGDAGGVLPAESIWAANGSNEVMHQCFAAFGGPGRHVLTFAPTYSMYPQYARDTFTEPIQGSRRADFTIDPETAMRLVGEYQPALTLIATPNNPTGTSTSVQVIADIAEAAQDGLVIVDEAYGEFRSPDVPSALTLLPSYPNVVVVRTMSKAFGLAGARVGYLAAHPSVVDALRVVRLPYHLSAVTQAVASTALDFSAALAEQIALLRRERDELARWLVDHDLEIAASDANFIMFGRFIDRDAVWQALLDRSVLIRQVEPVGWLRVSIGTPEQNAIFRHALADVLPQFPREGAR
jgi:histidinol-phosphate aminotransferase